MAMTLSPREEAILFGLLTRYIQTKEPVSSLVLAEENPEGLSSATVRHILAGLEEKGFLTQPHHTSGRVPTDLALRHLALLVQDQSQSQDAPDWQEVERLASSGSLNGLVQEMSGMLARTVHSLGFAVTPPVGEIRLRSTELVPLGEGRVLCVVVSQAGQVHQAVLRSPEPYTAEQLRWFSGYLNESFAGCSFLEIRRRLKGQMEAERSELDSKMTSALRLVAPYFLEHSEAREFFFEGTRWLLDDPQLRENLDSVKRLLESLELKAQLIDLLDDLFRGREPLRVVLGEDWPDPASHDLAMVVAPFGGEASGQGLVGIIGPKALRYETVIPNVRRAALLATLASARL
jgi:heat-inducible transcriptional repressor